MSTFPTLGSVPGGGRSSYRSTFLWADIGKAVSSETLETLAGKGAEPYVKEWASRELAQVTLRGGNPYKLANTALRDLFSRQSRRWLRRHPDATITSLGTVLLRNDEIADPVLRRAAVLAEQRGMLVGLNRVADQPLLYRLARGKVGSFLLESSAPDFVVGFGFQFAQDFAGPNINGYRVWTRSVAAGAANAATGALAYGGTATAFVMLGLNPVGVGFVVTAFAVGVIADLTVGKVFENAALDVEEWIFGR